MNTENLVTLLGKHDEHGFLVYVQEGTIETDAAVTLDDPALTLYVEAELIETGNSLAWLTEAELQADTLTVLLHDTDPVAS